MMIASFTRQPSKYQLHEYENRIADYLAAAGNVEYRAFMIQEAKHIGEKEISCHCKREKKEIKVWGLCMMANQVRHAGTLACHPVFALAHTGTWGPG